MEPERLVVGRIVKPHGLRGEVSIEVLSDAPDRFAPGTTMRGDDRDLSVATSRAHQGRLLVRFEQVDDRNGAESLRGVELTIATSDARVLPAGSYYAFQLEGLAVVDEAGVTLGRIIRIEESPANDIWVVGDGTREVLVPAVRTIVVSVDLEEGRIVLRPPEGLFP